MKIQRRDGSLICTVRDWKVQFWPGREFPQLHCSPSPARRSSRRRAVTLKLERAVVDRLGLHCGSPSLACVCAAWGADMSGRSLAARAAPIRQLGWRWESCLSGGWVACRCRCRGVGCSGGGVWYVASYGQAVEDEANGMGVGLCGGDCGARWVAVVRDSLLGCGRGGRQRRRWSWRSRGPCRCEDGETGQRGSISDRRERFLAPYRDARRDIPGYFANLSERLARARVNCNDSRRSSASPPTSTHSSMRRFGCVAKEP